MPSVTATRTAQPSIDSLRCAMAKKKRPAAALEDDAPAGPSSSNSAADSSVSPKFGQTLASNDKATRDKAVKALSRYLKSGRVTEELEMAKIWKALFYCMWHSDKPKVQSELADRLGGLVHAMPGSRAALFAKVFWATMMREWVGIDRLRLNKFYTLQRCVLQQSFRQLRQAGWPEGGAEALAQVLWQGPLSKAAPPGLRYWLVDNYVPALIAELKADTAAGVWMALLEPLFLALGAAPDSHSLQRTSEGAVEALLEMRGGKGKGDGDEEGEDEEDDEDEDDDDDDDEEEEEEVEPPPGLPIELAQLAERLFSLASDRTTREANRRQLYALQEKVEQLVREAGGGATKAAPSAAKAAPGAKAAVRADPAQVSTLLKLIGGKAGAKAGSKAQPVPPPAAEEAPKATSAKKKRRMETAVDDEPEEEPAPAPKAAKASKTVAAAAAAGEGAPKKKKVLKVKAGAKGK